MINQHNFEELIDRIFKPDGILEKKFNYEHRNKQHEYAIAVSKALFSGLKTRFIFQASTGIGKTLGYLIPLILHSIISDKVHIITTNTKGLMKDIESQKKLIIDILDELNEPSLKSSFKITRKISNRDRISKKKFEILKSIIEKSNEKDDVIWKSFCVWIEDGNTDLNEWLEDNQSGFPLDLTINDLGLTEEEKNDDSLKTITKTNILLMTHSMLQHLLLPNSFIENQILDELKLEKEIGLILCDEAETLPKISSGFKEDSIELKSISLKNDEINKEYLKLVDYINGIWNLCSKNPSMISENELKLTQKNFDQLNLPLKYDEIEIQFKDFLEQFKEVYKKQLNSDNIKLCDYQSYNKVVKIVEEFYNTLSQDFDYNYASIYPCITRNSSNVTGLKLIQYDNKKLLRPIRKIDQALILTSAYIDPSFSTKCENYIKDMGYDQNDSKLFEIKNFEPKEYGQLEFIGSNYSGSLYNCDKNISDSFKGFLINMIECSISGSLEDEYSSLILCNSYKMLDNLVPEIKINGMKVFRQARNGNLNKLLDEFQEYKGKKVLFTVKWDGINLHGLTDLIIPVIPFPPPSDKRYNKSDTIRKMAQGIGRAIRNKKSNCKIWIGDPRFPFDDTNIDISGYSSHDINNNNRDNHFRKIIPKRFERKFSEQFLFDQINGKFNPYK